MCATVLLLYFSISPNMCRQQLLHFRSGMVLPREESRIMVIPRDGERFVYGPMTITHRIHGAGIYANIWGILMINDTIHWTIHSSTMDPMDHGLIRILYLPDLTRPVWKKTQIVDQWWWEWPSTWQGPFWGWLNPQEKKLVYVKKKNRKV